jgi:hypothetical protein
MGNFHGHAIPGTLMMILGLFYFLRSLKVSWLRGLRTRQFWISFEALSFAFYGYAATRCMHACFKQITCLVLSLTLVVVVFSFGAHARIS